MVPGVERRREAESGGERRRAVKDDRVPNYRIIQTVCSQRQQLVLRTCVCVCVLVGNEWNTPVSIYTATYGVSVFLKQFKYNLI